MKVCFDFGCPGCPSFSSDNDAIISFLRHQPEDVIVGLAATSQIVAPIPDGHFVPTNFRELYVRGQHIPRSIMLGCNNDEGLLLWKFMAASLTAAGITWDMSMARATIQQVCSQLTTDSEAVERLGTAAVTEYLPDDTEDTVKATVYFLTDAYFALNTVCIANQCSRMYYNGKTQYFLLSYLLKIWVSYNNIL